MSCSSIYIYIRNIFIRVLISIQIYTSLAILSNCRGGSTVLAFYIKNLSPQIQGLVHTTPCSVMALSNKFMRGHRLAKACSKHH